MKLSITEREAHPLAVSLIAARCFMTLTIDGAAYHNSGWVCMLGGYLLALPLAVAIDMSRFDFLRATGFVWKAICAVFAAVMAYEAAAVSRLLINSLSYSNLETVSPVTMTLVMLLIAMYAVIKNGRGVGNAAKLWIIAFVVTFAIIIVMNLRYMRPRWLTPVLGPGTGKLIEGSISAAGNISCGALLHLFIKYADPRGRRSCVRSVTIGCAAGLALCLYWSMMSPMQSDGRLDRLTRLELLLSNGRTDLGVQLPMTFSWFMAYIVALAGYSYISTAFCQEIAPRINGKYIAPFTALVAFIIATAGLAESSGATLVASWEYPAFAALLALAGLTGFIKRKAGGNEKIA